MKIIVTTSNSYHHLLPVFFYLYRKYWNAPFELVGYERPDCYLPENCKWVSLGQQGTKTDFSTDLRKYFQLQPTNFIWLMEDTFIKSKVEYFKVPFDFGRIDLTNDVQKRPHTKSGSMIVADQNSRYRLSTQPSIWNKLFLLQYLKPGLSPWDFETQDPMQDGWQILGYEVPPLNHNEGVRRFDIYKLNLEGMAREDIEHINKIAPWQTK